MFYVLWTCFGLFKKKYCLQESIKFEIFRPIMTYIFRCNFLALSGIFVNFVNPQKWISLRIYKCNYTPISHFLRNLCKFGIHKSTASSVHRKKVWGINPTKRNWSPNLYIYFFLNSRKNLKIADFSKCEMG